MTEYKVDRQTAESEFDRFLDSMDIDGDTSQMSEEDRAGFESQRQTVVSAIMKGHLVINESGEPVLEPRTVEVPDGRITFHEPQGASYMAMDMKKKGHDVGKMFALMGEMTKQPPKVFANMKQRDLKICQAISVLFLA